MDPDTEPPSVPVEGSTGIQVATVGFVNIKRLSGSSGGKTQVTVVPSVVTEVGLKLTSTLPS